MQQGEFRSHPCSKHWETLLSELCLAQVRGKQAQAGSYSGRGRTADVRGSPETYISSQGLICLFLVLKDQRGEIAYRPPWVLFVSWSPPSSSPPPSSSLALPQLDGSFLPMVIKGPRWSFPGADPGLCTSKGRSRGFIPCDSGKDLEKRKLTV